MGGDDNESVIACSSILCASFFILSRILAKTQHIANPLDPIISINILFTMLPDVTLFIKISPR